MAATVGNWLLRVPLWGDFTAKLEVARFTRALGTLLANGVPLLSALAIARQIIGNAAIAAFPVETSLLASADDAFVTIDRPLSR